MKNIKRIFAVVLMLISLVVLASCGGGKTCTEHKDETNDGKCDVCGADMGTGDNGGENGGENGGGSTTPTGNFVIVENGVAKVQVVINKNNQESFDSYNLIKKFAHDLAKKGINITVVESDDASTVQDYEILIGDISSRGDQYHYDYRALGPTGKAVEIIGTKIILAGGNASSLTKVTEDFIDDVLDVDDPNNIVLEADNKKHCYVKPHDKAYDWESATIAGNDLKDYVIAVDRKAKFDQQYLCREAADYIQSEVYKKSGIWLKMVDTSVAGAVIPDKAIVIKSEEKTDSYNGLKMYIDGSKFIIETYYPAKLANTVRALLDENDTKFEIAANRNDTPDLRYVTYEEFGAKGDGKTNDYKAMYDTHEYANKYGHIVKATPGKNYLIGTLNGGGSIKIKTDVIWTGATITIDDSKIGAATTDSTTSVFRVESNYPSTRYEKNSDVVKAIIEAGGLKTTTTKIPFDLVGYESMIIPYDNNHRVYIRYGGNENTGNPQHEVIIVDKDGNIDGDTPILLDYADITYIDVYRIDDKPITIDGGTLVTIANRAPSAYTYYSRNINISRSNVTIKNMSRKIEGELDHGAPYSGFINPQNCNNLLVENCTFQAHRYYLNLDPNTGGATSMGTYEIGGGNSNNLLYKNCKQTNFYNYKSDTVNTGNTWYDMSTGETGIDAGTGKAACVWGVMGSNYCKNITYEGCELNRFDAHAGLYNASLIDSKTMMINLIGGGTALIKNTTVYRDSVMTLREDYGSTWHGEVVFDNVTQVSSSSYPRLIDANWANWYFGYDTYLPNVTIKNYKLEGNAKSVYVFSNFANEDFLADYVSKNSDKYPDEVNGDGLVPNKNKPHLPEYINVSENTQGITFIGSSSSHLNKKLTVNYLDEE